MARRICRDTCGSTENSKGRRIARHSPSVVNRASRYEIVDLAGDRTVKEQLIARYLKAEERASELSVKSVATTPANYRFSFKGVVDDDECLAYAFQIKPRRKRLGLIQAEIWLDQSTGIPVR